MTVHRFRKNHFERRVLLWKMKNASAWAFVRRTARCAGEVLKLWTNRPGDIPCLYIHDNLHPSRIEEYAGSFIRLTTEEE